MSQKGSIALTPYAIGQHFGPEARATRIDDWTPEEFAAMMVEIPEDQITTAPGYGPFCIHMFIPNFTGALLGAAEITPENQHLLKSGYKARRSGERPVLTRWFEGLTPERAPWLDLILYNKAQLEKEGSPIEADWGVVAILALGAPAETPMTPMTALRNALGTQEGGSGAALDRDYYNQCVEYWSTHAVVTL